MSNFNQLVLQEFEIEKRRLPAKRSAKMSLKPNHMEIQDEIEEHCEQEAMV